MSDQEPGLQPGITAPEAASGVESKLDEITRRRDEADDVLTSDIPSWDGDLKAKYRIIDRTELEKMIRSATSRARSANGGSGVEADADFLIKSCVGVIAIDPDDGETEIPLADGYDMSLVDILKPKFPKGHPEEGQPVPIKNERQLVVYLAKWNGIALASHAMSVAKWMQTTRKPIEDPQ